MRNRNIAVVAGVAGLGLVLSGCAGSSGPSGDAGSNSLTIATTSGNQASMEAVVEAYREKTGLDVNLTLADTSQYQTTLRTQLSSGTAPDVFTVWAGSGNPAAIDVLQGAGYLADLSDREWVGAVEPGTADTLKIDDKTYGLPSKLDALGVIYNENTLAELGLEIPTTYSGLLDFCGDVADQGKTALALGIQTDWVTQLIPYALVASTVYADDPDFDQKMAAGDATFAGSGWEKAFEQYLEMDEAGCFNADPLGTDVTASYALVNSGDAVGVVQVIASYPQIASTAPEGTEFGFFALPGDDDASSSPIPRGIGVSFAVNEKATNKDNALEFIDWLATPEALEVWFTAAPGIPALDVDFPMASNPVIDGSQEIIARGETGSFPDQFWPSAKVQSAHLIGVQQLFSGQSGVEDVLKSMDAAYAEG